MQIYKISINNAKKIFLKLGCDKGGIPILEKKINLHTIYIKNMHVGAANILKQDALSIGADLAVPSGVIIAKDLKVDAILIASTKHLEILSKKEKSQPFALQEFAKQIKTFIKNEKKPVKIMGVINANEDSFVSNSRFEGENAISKIREMINNGADIIDIGAVSSRPKSKEVSTKEELRRIKPIFDLIYSTKLYEKTTFSIDSYKKEVIKYALDSGFSVINDITGLENNDICSLASSYSAKVIIMHMQKTPKNMQEKPFYDDIILDIDAFFKERIEKAKSFGIKDIVLDVGIGFGKTLKHNLSLLHNLEHFKHFHHELLIGASRKSLINEIVPSETSQRLWGTLAIHLEAVSKGVSIIRCHDVKEHFQALRVQEAIRNQDIL